MTKYFSKINHLGSFSMCNGFFSLQNHRSKIHSFFFKPSDWVCVFSLTTTNRIDHFFWLLMEYFQISTWIDWILLSSNLILFSIYKKNVGIIPHFQTNEQRIFFSLGCCCCCCYCYRKNPLNLTIEYILHFKTVNWKKI